VAGSVLPPGLRRSATPPSHARSRRSADRPCHGRRTVGAPDLEGPGLRPHLEGSHPDPPRANGVRASRPSSDFDAARIHLGTPDEQRLWTCLPPVRCNLGLPIGAVGRHRVQAVSEPLGGDYHGAARVASVSRRIRACIRTVSSQVGSGGRRVEVRTRMRSTLRSDSRSCLSARIGCLALRAINASQPVAID
jgi:hypothetical protein